MVVPHQGIDDRKTAILYRIKVCDTIAHMFRPHIVRPDDDPDEITPEDLERLSVEAAKLRALVDNPIALIERARELLEGTAEPLFV